MAFPANFCLVPMFDRKLQVFMLNETFSGIFKHCVSLSIYLFLGKHFDISVFVPSFYFRILRVFDKFYVGFADHIAYFHDNLLDKYSIPSRESLLLERWLDKHGGFRVCYNMPFIVRYFDL